MRIQGLPVHTKPEGSTPPLSISVTVNIPPCHLPERDRRAASVRHATRLSLSLHAFFLSAPTPPPTGPNPKLGGNSLAIPNSTLSAVLLNSAIVSPIGWSTRGCHPSGRRSSVRKTRRSWILPPKIVRRVEELWKLRCVSTVRQGQEKDKKEV